MIHVYLVAPLLFLLACRAAHLGPDTNVAYHAAFEAQRVSDPANKPTFGADDARATNAARRGDKAKAGAASGYAPASLSAPAASATGGEGAWQGAQRGISLEAK